MKGTKRFVVRGMHCAACVALVRKKFEAVNGTVSASIDLSSETAIVAWEGEAEPEDSAYVAAIEPFGYEAERS
jgi:copper chaperone CopZ